MPRRTAGDDCDFVECTEGIVRDVEVLEEDLPAIDRDAAENRVSRCSRLFVDLLEHEVPMAALLCGDRIPQHALRRLRDGAS